MLILRRVERALVAHVERVLVYAHAPHVLAVLGARQRERSRLALLLALDAERTLVVYYVSYIHPPAKEVKL